MANNTQQGTQKGVPQRDDDELPEDADALSADDVEEGDAEDGDVEKNVANDAGTKPGRKVDHADPHDIPPRGMKRNY